MNWEFEEKFEQESLKQSRKRTKLSVKRTEYSRERRDLALQRTHLANQRTFQAWIRTSLSLVGFGFGIAKFLSSISEDQGNSDVYILGVSVQLSVFLGILMIFVGIFLTVIAYIRYYILEKRIGRNFRISYPWTSLVVVLCILIGGVVFLIDIIRHLLSA